MNIIKKPIDFKPRDYQLYYLKKALERNVIICLGTGSGKTYITIMLLKDYGEKIFKFKKKAIFLAPTTPLVVQQAEEIRKHTNFNIKTYYGDLGVDTWDLERWNTEIESNDVLTLTPDIFYTLITKKILDLQRICCLIFDEAHHACLKRKGNGLEETNHVYKKIMNFIIQENYHNSIRIIGTTASVVNSCVDPVHLPDCFNEIEKTYNARILGEFEFDPRFLAEPYIQTWLFKEEIFVSDEYSKLYEITNDLEKLIRQYNTKNNKIKNILQINEKSYLTEKPLLKPKYVRRMIRDIWEGNEKEIVHIELGVYPAYLVCLEFIKELELTSQSIFDQNLLIIINMALIYLKLMKDIYKRSIEKFESISKEDAIINLSTVKLCRLLDVIHQYYQIYRELTCLIFVDRVLFSFVISKYLEFLSESSDHRLNFIKPSFFVGNNNDYLNFKFIKDSVRNFKTTMNDFKNQKFNILTTTAVLEEGIDIGKCNLVIRFNDIKTYREFVQSKGRARAKNSFYVIIHNDLSKLEMQTRIYKNTENYLKNKFKLSKTEEFNKPVLQDYHQIGDKEECFRSKTNALMSLSSAGPFLTRYIIKKGNKDYMPEYTVDENSNGYQIKLSLKGVTPIKEDVVGKFYIDKMDAMKSACLEACKKLYEIGQLDDHFIPISNQEVIAKCNLIEKEYSKSEQLETKLFFHSQQKQRFFFEKKINNYSFFKEFCKSTYNLYEIEFITEDKYLKEGNEKLGLLTELKLNDDCLNNIVFSSKYTTNIKLNSIKKDFRPSDNQLVNIKEFTFKIFQSTIASLKKGKENVKFEYEKCLFKFVFINKNEIDFDLMDSIVNFNEAEITEDDLFNNSLSNRLVRAIHTNIDYKILNTNTNVYPSDLFEFKGDKISYNDYFEKIYQRIIYNQKRQLIKVEKADLNIKYSIFIKDRINVDEDKKHKFDAYLPFEFLVVSSLDKFLFKKINCLPPLIYRIKQKIILRSFQKSLAKEILGHEDDNETEDSLNIFNINSEQYCNNIDEFIKEIFEKKSTLPYFDDDETDSSDENFEDNEQIIDDSNAEEQFENATKKINKSSKIKNKEEKIFRENEYRLHIPCKSDFLNNFLNNNLERAIIDNNFNSVDNFIKKFTDQFEKILKSFNEKHKLKNFEDIEPKG